jgi:hypothetical protein
VWTTGFVVDDKECDSIADLSELRKRTTEFRVKVSAPQRSRELSISKFRSEVEIYDYPRDEQLSWSIYAKIESIFNKKRLGVKARTGYVLVILLFAGSYIPLRHFTWSGIVLIPMGLVAGMIFAKMWTLSSVVVLVPSHKAWTFKTFLENEENRSKIVVAAATALITLIAKAAYDWLTKRPS